MDPVAPATPTAQPAAQPAAGAQAAQPAAGAPAAQPAAGAPAAQPVVGQPAAPQVAKPAPQNLVSHLDKYFKQPDAGVLTPEDAAKPITRADMIAHQERVEQTNKIRQFHDDLRSIVNKPVTFGGDLGLSHAFETAEQVDDFARFSSRILSNGLSAQQLLMLHSGDRLLQQAYEKGGRDFETKLSKGRQAAAPITPGQPESPTRVVTPEAPNNKRSKVESTEDILKRTNPDYYAAIMKGDVNLV